MILSHSRKLFGNMGVLSKRKTQDKTFRPRVINMWMSPAMSENAPDLGPDGIAARSRLHYDAKHRGRVVARAVASDPLDHYALAGQITERQHEAGIRLRIALSGSWFRARVTAPAGYASDVGLDDDDPDAALTDEERKEVQDRHWATQREAEAILGDRWGIVSGVCGGAWATSYHGGIPAMRAGLNTLADGWGMERY